jgi:protoporphyrinogen oxidase
MNSPYEDMTVLGGGASGLCVGFYARKSGLSFKIHEATDTIGGNAATLQFKEFRFDTGAHRWHDRFPECTQELKNMIGHDLEQIHVPSHIYNNHKLLNFPLSPLNLLRNVGPFTFAKAGFEVLSQRAFYGHSKTNFEDFAINTYGRSIASRFLLNYSEKLWGLPCNKLSPQSAGERMKGLNLKTFVWEALYGAKAKVEHLDGLFYYPQYGIADILNKWADACGKENILRKSKITKIFHNNHEILSIEMNGTDRSAVKYLVTTLPLTHFLNMLIPSPPVDILELGNSLIYRHIKLVALFIDKPSVTKSATIYFPGKEFLFTRLYEPKNRSIHMSPDARTSLIMEIPCQADSEYWRMADSDLINKAASTLCAIGWIREREILDALVYPMHYAYPVFESGYEDKVKKLFRYLKKFKNLAFAGRSSRFEYIHLHDIMKSGKEIVDDYKIRFLNGFPSENWCPPKYPMTVRMEASEQRT